MTKKTFRRIFFSLLLLVSVLFAPFWLSVILALVGMIYFDVFWEGVLLLLVSDLLYGTKQGRFLNIIYLSFVVSLLCIILIELIKKKLRLEKVDFK